jgi:hypothetical protein
MTGSSMSASPAALANLSAVRSTSNLVGAWWRVLKRLTRPWSLRSPRCSGCLAKELKGRLLLVVVVVVVGRDEGGKGQQ